MAENSTAPYTILTAPEMVSKHFVSRFDPFMRFPIFSTVVTFWRRLFAEEDYLSAFGARKTWFYTPRMTQVDQRVCEASEASQTI